MLGGYWSMEYFIEQTLDYIKIVIGIFFILIAILFWADTQKLEALNVSVVRFVDRVRYEGYITQDMFEDFERRTSIISCKINMQHLRFDLNQSAERVYTVYNEKTIYDEIFSDKRIYKMNKGDDFIIIVTPLQISGYKYLMRALGGKPLMRERPILRGGLVYNEAYHGE
jgi:hypothetical protein